MINKPSAVGRFKGFPRLEIVVKRPYKCYFIDEQLAVVHVRVDVFEVDKLIWI